MDDKYWFQLFVMGMGEVAMWISEEELKQGMMEGEIVAENITAVQVLPQGSYFRKIAEKGTILSNAVSYIGVMNPSDVEQVAKVWNEQGRPVNGRIQLPNDRDRKKFGL